MADTLVNIDRAAVCFVTPNSGDSDLGRQLLNDAGIHTTVCHSLSELCARYAKEIGCAIVVEESIVQGEIEHLLTMLAQQPAWSDLPLILIASQQTPLQNLVERIFKNSGNVTLLERPLNPATLVSAVRVAMRARARQYEVRGLLAGRDEALQRQNEFLAMLAHELRNPLAPIRNSAHVMKLLNIQEPRFERARSVIERQVTHLSKLVDDLLEVARLERGKIELKTEVLNLNALVASVVEAFAKEFKDRDQKLHTDFSTVPLYASCDPTRIEQIIANLLNNASKYTPPGGQIRVATAQDESSGMAQFSISDSGIGIPKDKLLGIFDLFAQTKRSLARSEGGLGIGLTVVKRLVELHHGTVYAQSAGADKGATFMVSLPSVETPVQNSSPNVLKMPPSKRRILVIEDNADIRESLELLLGMWGHDVTLTETGSEGLQRIIDQRPDVALIDIGLPGMDGYEVARALRARQPMSVLLVAMTGYGQPDDVKKAMEAGFDLHLLKPIDPDRLAQVLSA